MYPCFLLAFFGLAPPPLFLRVLPSKQTRGEDLGLMYDAIHLPLIMSPLIGGVVLA